ncbi:hypothetical protein QT972_07205 [Microcoleus sp. herbarium7]
MSIRGFFVGGAGLFNLSASFKADGEPAPTSPTQMVPYLSYKQPNNVVELLDVAVSPYAATT